MEYSHDFEYYNAVDRCYDLTPVMTGNRSICY